MQAGEYRVAYTVAASAALQGIAAVVSTLAHAVTCLISVRHLSTLWSCLVDTLNVISCAKVSTQLWPRRWLTLPLPFPLPLFLLLSLSLSLESATLAFRLISYLKFVGDINGVCGGNWGQMLWAWTGQG